MAGFDNFGTVVSQKLLDEFSWRDKEFFSYLISFNEYNGFFKIIRQKKHEQALIGAQVLFNYSEQEDKIIKYRIVGFKSSTKKNSTSKKRNC